MTREERDRIADEVPLDDVEAAVLALLRTLDDGELDEELVHILADQSGRPGEMWERLRIARSAWRAARGLPQTPMPFALGE